ncbi:gag/pol protein [Cucumis melo var. makuwa]|nr:gag/pol protein [Cucumis melo var. makuwa]
MLPIPGGKAKVAIKGKCFHCNVDGHWKRNYPKYLAKKKEKEGATNHVCSSLRKTSSFKQLEESEMTLKVRMGDVISTRAVGDAKLGHINLDRIGRLVKNGLLNELEDHSLPPYESCLEGKMTKRPFTGKGYRAKEPLKLIHSDLCGSMNVKARGDFEYFISFIDDYSRYGYLYLMEHKSEALEKLKEYKDEVENLLSKKIKILRSDRGGEYMDLRFQDYMIEHRIQSQLSAPGTPQQNGVSERRNRTLLDMVRSMMSYAQLPSSFWEYEIENAVHILNNILSKSVSETLFELCQFVGYPKETRGGLVSDLQENRVFVPTNATFLEEDHMRDHKPRSKLVLNKATDGSTRIVDEVGPSSRVDETTTSGQSHPSQSLRMPRCSGRVVSLNRYLGLTKTQVVIPDDVWELVNLLEGVKPIGCKWIYKRKRDSAGKVQTFKARLVAKGPIPNERFRRGTTQYVLGIQIIRDHKNKMHEVHLSKEQGPKTPQEVEDMRRIPYASAVGSLMYAMLCTMPDIYYAVGHLLYSGNSQFIKFFVGLYYQVLQQQLDYVYWFFSHANTMIQFDGNFRESATTMLRKHKENQTRPYGLHASFLPLVGLLLAVPLPEKLKRKKGEYKIYPSSGSVERTHQSRDPKGCMYQFSDPEGYMYQSSDREEYTYQSSDPEGCTYQSSDPEGYTYQSSDPEGYTYQ